MPWNICDLMKKRSEFVQLVGSIRSGTARGSITELCRRYGISRKTGYKWLDRHAREGESGLADRSRAPRRRPQKTPEPVEARVLELRDRYPGWGDGNSGAGRWICKSRACTSPKPPMTGHPAL